MQSANRTYNIMLSSVRQQVQGGHFRLIQAYPPQTLFTNTNNILAQIHDITSKFTNSPLTK